MVCFNFRTNHSWTREELIKFFQRIGYTHRRKNGKSIKKDNEFVSTEEFLRRNSSGRYHIFVEIGQKATGTRNYPRIKVFGHFDIIKVRKGKEKHFFDQTELRILKEMQRIDKQLKSLKLGHMEFKDRNCGHATLEIHDIERLVKEILKDYEKCDNAKFKKVDGAYKYVLQVFEQHKYAYVTCICGYVKDKHEPDILKKKLAEKELKRIKAVIKKRC